MKGKWPLVLLLGVVAVVLLTTIQGCGLFGFDATVFVDNLICQDPHYTIPPGPPGRSVKLMNPCPFTRGGTVDGLWDPPAILPGFIYPVVGFADTFDTGPSIAPFFPGAVNGISVTTMFNRTTNQTERFLVADSTAIQLANVPISYVYNFFCHSGCPEFNNGAGTLFVTVAGALAVSAGANPATVAAGNTSQLNASVTGGVPPYSFAWSPSTSLSNITIANPIATPTATTTYTVKVTDSAGATATATTSVTVSSPLFFILTVHVTGTNEVLQISPAGGFILCNAGSSPGACTGLFVPGTTVRLAEISLVPVSWTGCDSVGPESPTIPLSTCTVVMNGNKIVTAAF